jgi:hypothetical protein
MLTARWEMTGLASQRPGYRLSIAPRVTGEPHDETHELSQEGSVDTLGGTPPVVLGSLAGTPPQGFCGNVWERERTARFDGVARLRVGEEGEVVDGAQRLRAREGVGTSESIV